MQSETTVFGILEILQHLLAPMAAKIVEILHPEPSHAHVGHLLSRTQELAPYQPRNHGPRRVRCAHHNLPWRAQRTLRLYAILR
ncbi:MAG TPA: hypothetical protein VKK31_25445 [Thermoanaerobaculia bacterium]|nr:hypothetical protein [Thermoanaerobaculia bacterium]